MNSSKNIDCYIIPQYQIPILMPEAAVVEHIGYPDLDPNLVRTTPWILGYFNWREIVIPLISMEHFGSEDFDTKIHRRGRRRVVVGHVLNSDLGTPFMGILSHGTPWKTQANKTNLSELEQLDSQLPFIGKMRIRATEVIVPDLERIGEMVSMNNNPGVN